MTTSVKKKITRRKPGTGPSVYYFTDDTQKAIIEFAQTNDQEEKKGIYTTRIYPAFKALVENLINVYGFQVQYESKEDLRNECVEFLFGVIKKFDPTRGTRAFAYFNVVAKHWLTIKAKQNTKSSQIFTSLDDPHTLTVAELEAIESYRFLPSPDETGASEYELQKIKELMNNLAASAKTEQEKNCMEAILTLFKDAENLDIISKRGVMVYIRSLTSLSPKQLSVVLSSLKKQYKNLKTQQLEKEIKG